MSSLPRDLASINVDDLSAAFVDAKPQDFDFSEGYGEKWDIVRPDVDSWGLRRCSAFLEDEGYSGDAPQVNPFDMDRPTMVDLLADVGIESFDDETDDELREAVIANMDDETIGGIDEWRDCVRSALDHSDREPMMNCVYPIGKNYDSDAISDLPCCVVVETEGDQFLALSGCGMDLSWEICESYIRLGFLPPFHFCDLPRMAGRGKSDHDKVIIRACKESAQVLKMWADRQIERLAEMESE